LQVKGRRSAVVRQNEENDTSTEILVAIFLLLKA